MVKEEEEGVGLEAKTFPMDVLFGRLLEWLFAKQGGTLYIVWEYPVYRGMEQSLTMVWYLLIDTSNSRAILKGCVEF